jgi:transcriptional regulator GlxA family with amidase domain
MEKAHTVEVYFVLLPDTLLLDVSGPAEVLRLAAKLAVSNAIDADAETPPRFELRYLSPCETVDTSIGLPLNGLSPLPRTIEAGAIIVIAGTASLMDEARRAKRDEAEQTVAAWLSEIVAGNPMQRVLTVCSGALVAARAGLLDGRLCTTHHALCDELQSIAPSAKVLNDRLYVTDGPISTSAGITAGIDLALQLVADLGGARLASAVARDMVVYMRRAGADPQLSPWVDGRNHLHRALHRVQDAVAANPAHDWTSEEMARIACSSSRHLARLFQQHANTNPVDYVHRLRIAVARELIAHSSLDMEAVALRCGFGSVRQMRRVWHKFEAKPPSKHRRGRAEGRASSKD